MAYEALEDLEIFQLAEQICDRFYELTPSWKHFDQETIGIQLIRAADSVGANIAESYGRYHYGEKLIENANKSCTIRAANCASSFREARRFPEALCQVYLCCLSVSYTMRAVAFMKPDTGCAAVVHENFYRWMCVIMQRRRLINLVSS